MSSTKVAILGHGTIGGGVSRILLENIGALAKKAGKQIELAAICTINPEEDEMYAKHAPLFKSADEALSNPEISIICETIGGDTIALEFVKRALRSGKHVVTANKKMIALHFQELHELAKKNNVALYYEAAVGGGIPMLSAARSGLSGDNIQKIEGILNGTTNFILTQMEESGADFADVLQEAQKLGYAEADPTDDVEGFDAAYKLTILIALAFEKYITPKHIPTKGISSLSVIDFKYADILGKKIKLLATAEKKGDAVFARISPVLISKGTRIAKTGGVLNAVNFTGKYNTEGNFLSGEGAGRFPTAAAIVSDIVTIAKGDTTPLFEVEKTEIISAPKQSWYLRFLVNDRPGIVGEIGMIFAKHHISIDSVHQVDHQKDPAHFIITTMPVEEEIFQKALTEISALDCNHEKPFIIPIRA